MALSRDFVPRNEEPTDNDPIMGPCEDHRNELGSVYTSGKSSENSVGQVHVFPYIRKNRVTALSLVNTFSTARNSVRRTFDEHRSCTYDQMASMTF